jgi:hypothetical protein
LENVGARAVAATTDNASDLVHLFKNQMRDSLSILGPLFAAHHLTLGLQDQVDCREPHYPKTSAVL